MPSTTLSVARDPALALVVRIFVGSVAARWGVAEQDRDDLRLAASELFSSAVGAGAGASVAFTLSSDDVAVILRADGLDTSAGAERSDPSWGDRFDLVRALFPDAELGEGVSIRVSAAAQPS
jgi:hypothetical protein